MSTTIRLKKSGATGNVPSNSSLEFGELALNYADGVLYYKDATNNISQISGTSANTFETINANGTLIIADSNTDILTLLAGDNVFITGNGITDAITIGVRSNDSFFSTATDTLATANVVNGVYSIATSAHAKANAPITIKEVYASNATVINTFSDINTIQFDADSGMAVVDESNNTVTIQLNSTFKNWNVDGNTGLVAFGLDTVNFIAGEGISITANNSNTPKSIIFEATGGGGAGPSVVESDVFTANGVQSVFTLSKSTSTDKTFVYFSGVAQVPEVDYQVSGKTLTFNTAPLNGTTIEVRSIIDVTLVNTSSFISDTYTANGAQTVYQLSGFPYSSNGLFVFVDGVTQVPFIDYTVAGDILTFTAPPEANGIIEARSVVAIQATNFSLSNNDTVLQVVSNSQMSFTSGGFSSPSDSISRTYILRGITTDGVESELFLDAANNRIVVPANTTVFYTADIVARRTDATDESAGYQLKGVVDNFSGTVADVGSLYEVIVAEDDVDYVVDARADNTNNTINIFVTGETGKTIRWTALVKTVEVAQ
jgi:hypothetical protein